MYGTAKHSTAQHSKVQHSKAKQNFKDGGRLRCYSHGKQQTQRQMHNGYNVLNHVLISALTVEQTAAAAAAE
jgi:hypothetical protein